MTLSRALLSEALRLARSPSQRCTRLRPDSRSCPAASTSVTRWDPALGADAYAQFLGALMPLMSAIVCGLAVDEERLPGASPTSRRSPCGRASRRSYSPCRRARRGRAGRGARRVQGPCSPSPGACRSACSACGRLGGHRAGQPAPLRAGARRGPAPRPQRRHQRRRGGDASRSSQWADLRTASRPASSPVPLATPLSWVPLAWPTRLGSLGVEASSTPRAAGPLLTTALAGLVLPLAAAAVLLAWFCRFRGRVRKPPPPCSPLLLRSARPGRECPARRRLGSACARSPTACCPTLDRHGRPRRARQPRESYADATRAGGRTAHLRTRRTTGQCPRTPAHLLRAESNGQGSRSRGAAARACATARAMRPRRRGCARGALTR